jgi:hypothetical protein
MEYKEGIKSEPFFSSSNISSLLDFDETLNGPSDFVPFLPPFCEDSPVCVDMEPCHDFISFIESSISFSEEYFEKSLKPISPVEPAPAFLTEVFAQNPTDLSATLARLSPDRPNPNALRDIYVFVTCLLVSSTDWTVLVESGFFVAILPILLTQETQGDIVECWGLAIACLRCVFSQGISERPPDSIAEILTSTAHSIVPIFANSGLGETCPSEFLGLGADLMLFVRDPLFADDLMRPLSSFLIRHIQESNMTEILSAVWYVMHAWFRCTREPSDFQVLDCLGRAVVPRLDTLKPEDFIHLDSNLIRVVRDACRVSCSLGSVVANSTFPRLLYNDIVRSPDQSTAPLFFSLVEILLPVIRDFAWVDPAGVDELVRQWPDYSEMVFRLGISVITTTPYVRDDWLTYAEPNIESPFTKIYFSTFCLGYWIHQRMLPLPDYAVFVPILTDLIYVEDPEINPCVCGLLLSYLDMGNDSVVEALLTYLNDGEIGEILRLRTEEYGDVVEALRAVLNPHLHSEFGAP